MRRKPVPEHPLSRRQPLLALGSFWGCSAKTAWPPCMQLGPVSSQNLPGLDHQAFLLLHTSAPSAGSDHTGGDDPCLAMFWQFREQQATGVIWCTLLESACRGAITDKAKDGIALEVLLYGCKSHFLLRYKVISVYLLFRTRV